MIKIDKRFDEQAMDIINTFPGRVFRKYRNDPFLFTPSVYGIIGIYIGDAIYKITNFLVAADYYGKPEDVADFRIERASEQDIHSYMDDGELTDTYVESVISKVHIINENQRLYHNGIQTYDVYVTRGIIIELEDGLEISFEKDVWFSEEINIEKGYDLIDKFASTTDFEENWEGIEEYRSECTRETITVE